MTGGVMTVSGQISLRIAYLTRTEWERYRRIERDCDPDVAVGSNSNRYSTRTTEADTVRSAVKCRINGLAGGNGM